MQNENSLHEGEIKNQWLVRCQTKYGAVFEFRVIDISRQDLMCSLQGHKDSASAWLGESFIADFSDVCFFKVLPVKK